MDKNTPLGPNAKRLLILFMSREAVPPGGGIADGARFFLDAEHRKAVSDKAWDNMNTAINAVKSTTDNPYGDDEEAIAGAILQAVDGSVGGRAWDTEATAVLNERHELWQRMAER